MGAPAPDQRIRERPVVSRIPAHAFQRAGDAKFPELVREIRGQRLADGVSGRIEQVQFRLHAILFPDAVVPGLPARLIKKRCRALRVIFHLGRFAVPRHLVAHAVCRTSVSVQHMVDHFLPVNAHIDRPAHPHVRREVISHSPPLCVGLLRHSREIESPVVHRGIGRQRISFDLLVRVSGGRIGQIHLAGLCRKKCCIFLHKEDRHFLHQRLPAVVIRIRLQDYLLPPVPLLQDISARTDGRCAVCRTVIGVFRHDPGHSHGVGPDGERPVHMEHNRTVIRRFRIVQHGKITDRTGIFDSIVCKSHIIRGKRLPIRKGYVIPDRNRPNQAVFADRIIRRQIIPDGKIRVRHRQGALDQRLMNMFACAPAVRRIETGRRFGIRIHGHHHFPRPGPLLRRLRGCPGSRTCSFRAAPAAGCRTCCGQRQCR